MSTPLEMHLDKRPELYFGDTATRRFLFHYTGIDNTKNILTGKELWASKIQYMNDYKEFIHAIEIVDRLCNEQARAHPDAKELFDKIKTMTRDIEGLNIHILSFSEEDDLLSQWRAYSLPHGFVLGFEFDKLKDVATENGFIIGKCIYDDAEKIQIIRRILNIYREIFVSNPDILDDLSPGFYEEFYKWAALFKHKAFREEKEWRMISAPTSNNHKNVDIRSTQTMLIPYYKMKLDIFGKDNRGDIILPIEHVVIGPHPNSKLLSDGFSYLLSKYHIKCSAIRYSTCPYRLL
ncbi:DUF2971 domain-containing protein [Kiloniella sp.]|uniref:DUF2971 domain-containing protein n=1 Tax=Kiloniella sp. TaxID=1938587 RepID=UPI003A91ABD9